MARACAKELEGDARLPIKFRRALACDHGEDGQAQLIHQIVSEQIVLEFAATNHQNIPAWGQFEWGDLLMGVGQCDDERIVPGR